MLPRGWKYPAKSDGLARPGKCHVCKGVEIVEIYLARLISFDVTRCGAMIIRNYALSVEKLEPTSSLNKLIAESLWPLNVLIINCAQGGNKASQQGKTASKF